MYIFQQANSQTRSILFVLSWQMPAFSNLKMSYNSEDGNEVIRLFIVGEDGKEVEVDQSDLGSYIKLEITNTEDVHFGLNESEYIDLTENNQLSTEDALLLDNIKVEVIDDPEAEFGDILEPPDDDETVELLEEESENEDDASQTDITPFKRYKRRRITRGSLDGQNRRKKLHTCSVCGYTSHQKSHYRRHLTIHFKPEGLRCSVCRKPMLAKAELTDHMEEHRCPEDRNRFLCNLCPYTSNKLTNVAQHTEVHYKPKKEKLECEHCNFASTNRARFRTHAAIHKGTKRNTKCPVCLIVFKSMALRRRHIQRYKSPDDPNRFQCPECAYTTIKFNNFKQHMVVHRNEYEIEMFQCSYCPFKSKRKTDLRQHVVVKHKTIDEVTLYQCDFCSYESRRGNHLTSHMKNRHQKTLVVKKCGLCSYKTVSQVLIERHLSIHTKVPEGYFLCYICGFGCTSQVGLEKHMELKHSNEDDDGTADETLTSGRVKKEIDTDNNHGYSFELMTVKNEPESEQENEEGDRELAVFCCQFQQCNFITDVERDAKIHLAMCHSKKGDDNKCPECTFHTTSRYLYLDHLKVHMIDIEHLKPHLCEICGSRWIRQGDLTRHMAVHWGSGKERRRRRKYSNSNNEEEHTTLKKLLKCSMCSYTTRIRLCLYKHMLKHGEEHQANFVSHVIENESSECSD